MQLKSALSALAVGASLAMAGCATTSDDVSRQAQLIHAGHDGHALAGQEHYGQYSALPGGSADPRMCKQQH